MIRGKLDPQWSALVEEWKAIQHELRKRIIVRALEPLPRYVAGVDAAYSGDKQTCYAAAVVYDREAARVVEVAHASRPAEFPYVPTFLSFREGPTVRAAVAQLAHPYGAILFDGQGYAHPRRCGLACHMGVILDIPAVGVGKSRLIGTFDEPAPAAGSYSPLMDGPEQIGLVLRSRAQTNPIFVSIGHRVDLESARKLVFACCTKYRIPEPTRQADIEVAKVKLKS